MFGIFLSFQYRFHQYKEHLHHHFPPEMHHHHYHHHFCLHPSYHVWIWWVSRCDKCRRARANITQITVKRWGIVCPFTRFSRFLFSILGSIPELFWLIIKKVMTSGRISATINRDDFFIVAWKFTEYLFLAPRNVRLDHCIKTKQLYPQIHDGDRRMGRIGRLLIKTHGRYQVTF